MKKITLVAIISLVCLVACAQINKDTAIKYLTEVQDTNNMYRDVLISNVDNGSWPALGKFRTEVSLYYSYDSQFGENVKMVAIDYSKSVIRYSDYYIYDEFQNLTYYIYQSEHIGNLTLKFDGEKYEVIAAEEGGMSFESYFEDKFSEFNVDSIRKKSDVALAYCDFMWGLPNFQKEILDIDEEIYEINSDTCLIVKQSGNINTCYLTNVRDKKWVEGDLPKEYYFVDEKLIFIHYAKTENGPEKKIYLSNGKIFWIDLGGATLVNTSPEFITISSEIWKDYSELFETQ